ncbi:hypothetical protein BU16DRAFT_594272 [Lophium mytilinum]|uniref:DUF4440 domain-containing protein n=1 Tax=Lophium mytilinum TaxID=390894 RepID=A0A6A6QGN6_9PEZI|nr:hypothetical protein BU16DRAFT_594272 [Lophium mytilinum]
MPFPPPSSPEAPIHTLITAFFAAIHTQDWPTLRTLIVPTGHAILSRGLNELNEGTDLHSVPLPALIDHLEGSKPFEEPIHDVKIMVDRDLACVWAPFEIRVDGVKTATGTNVFTCLKREGVWRVSAVVDRNAGVVEE